MPREVNLSNQVLSWLSNPVNFAANLVKVEGACVTLDDWQKSFLLDESKFISILKSRRVGGSWIMTLKMFIRSQLQRSYSGTFISLNLEEAKGKIEYADAMYESLPRRFKKKRIARSKTELVFEDAYGNRSTLRSLASKAPRGKGGDVGISELPHCRAAEEIYEGALHVTSRSASHSFVIESSPLGKSGIFHDISNGKFEQFSLYRIPWWKCSSLCVDVSRAKREAPKLNTASRIKSFGTPSMLAIYSSMPKPAFKQESELQFLDSESSVFSVELLHQNATPSFGISSDADLKFLSLSRAPLASEWQWLKENIKGRLYAGFDVGRKKDESVLFVIDKVGDRLESRMLVRLKDIDFTSQENILKAALQSGIIRLAIDATGIGLPLSEKLEQAHGSRVIPVHFTSQIKSKMVNRAQMIMLDKKLRLPLERSIIAQLGSIEQKVTDSGNVIFTVATSPDHHADIAWAILLCCHASHQAEEAGV